MEYSCREKSLSGDRGRKWQLLSHQGLSVVTVSTLPIPTLWPPAPFAALTYLFPKHQSVSVITDAIAFRMEQVYPGGTGTSVGMEW